MLAFCLASILSLVNPCGIPNGKFICKDAKLVHISNSANLLVVASFFPLADYQSAQRFSKQQ